MIVLDALALVTWVLVPAVAAVVAWRRLRRSGSRAVTVRALLVGVSGLVIVGLAVIPSVAAAVEDAFASHMVQHLALGLVGPLLIVTGRMPELGPWLMPIDRRRPLLRAYREFRPRSVVAPTGAIVVTWYAWHVPGLYGLAADEAVVHVIEHATFLGVGLWYWAAVAPHRRRTGAVVLASFTVTLSLGLLGAVLSLSPGPFYGDHVDAVTSGSELADQHLGGLLMWTPGGVLCLVTAVVQLVRWLDIDRTRPEVARLPTRRTW